MGNVEHLNRFLVVENVKIGCPWNLSIKNMSTQMQLLQLADN